MTFFEFVAGLVLGAVIVVAAELLLLWWVL